MSWLFLNIFQAVLQSTGLISSAVSTQIPFPLPFMHKNIFSEMFFFVFDNLLLMRLNI